MFDMHRDTPVRMYAVPSDCHSSNVLPGVRALHVLQALSSTPQIEP